MGGECSHHYAIPAPPHLCQLRSDIQTASIAQNMITIYERDLLYLSFYRSANIQEHKKGGKNALKLLEALTLLQVIKRHIP